MFFYLLRYPLVVLVPVAVTSTTYLYLYPVFHGCAFPLPHGDEVSYDAAHTAWRNTLSSHLLPDVASRRVLPSAAPFRLLALGDPQLEGDSSLRDPNYPAFPPYTSLLRNLRNQHGQHNPLQRLRHTLHDLIDLVLDDVPGWLDGHRKQLDLFGNDYYLAHVYRSLHWWARPTHVSVLGDLLGSQWVDDREFAIRTDRFWHRVFRGGERVDDEIMVLSAEDIEAGVRPAARLLGAEAAQWTRRIINIAGNHDIGYAGDLTEHRLQRFEDAYGLVNYELRFHLLQHSISRHNDINNSTANDAMEQSDAGEIPELRIVVLNSMNLDTPAFSSDAQDQTYSFLNRVITTSPVVDRPALFTLLLTHIPLYKQAGVCVDAPFFDFWPDWEQWDGVREQNQLSADVSRSILEGIYGMSGDPTVDGQGRGRNGLIINGHDHEGCDTYHYINQSEPDIPFRWNDWEVTNTGSNASARVVPLKDDGFPGLREVTLRAMMGEYGGNAGLVSLWFDEDSWEWKYDVANCALGKQHIWWAVHVVDLVTVILLFLWSASCTYSRIAQTIKRAMLSSPMTMLHSHIRSAFRNQGSALMLTQENEHIDKQEYEDSSRPGSANGLSKSAKRSLRKKRSKTRLAAAAEGIDADTSTDSQAHVGRTINGQMILQHRRPLSSVYERLE